MSEFTGQSNVTPFKTESFAPTPEVLAAWNAVYKDLRDEFGEAVYRSWLKPLTLQAYYNGTEALSMTRRAAAWASAFGLPTTKLSNV